MPLNVENNKWISRGEQGGMNWKIGLDIYTLLCIKWSSLRVQIEKEFTCNAGDLGSTPGSERSSEDGNGNLLQYSCLKNFEDRGAWRATYSPCSHKESDTTERLVHTHL